MLPFNAFELKDFQQFVANKRAIIKVDVWQTRIIRVLYFDSFNPFFLCIFARALSLFLSFRNS